MRYSFIVAGLAASAIANPFVDIVVGEDGVTSVRHRHHNGHRGGWFSFLLGNSRSHNRGNRKRHHNDQRRHHHDHNRHRDISTHMAEGDDDGEIGQHYECILTARRTRDERENTKRCCDAQGGELYESRGHCILRDTTGDPSEEWQTCGMDARGTDFAACYQREQKEIDDELAGRGQHDDEDEGHKHGRKRGRHGRNHHGGRMTVFGIEDDSNHSHKNHGRHGKHDGRHHKKQEIFECRIDMADDNRRQQLLQQCCEQDVGGRLDSKAQTCWNVRKGDRTEFENCAMAQGAQSAECYKPDDSDDDDRGRDWLADLQDMAM